MKRLLYRLAFVWTIILLAGCQKEVPNGAVTDALTVKPAGNAPELVYPIGSVFYSSDSFMEDGKMFKGLSYSFCRDKLTQLNSNDSILVTISGRQYNDINYTEQGQWIENISISKLDESLKLGTSISIPLEHGVFIGDNDLINDVRINAFQSTDIDIVITTKAGDIITIVFTGIVLIDDRRI